MIKKVDVWILISVAGLSLFGLFNIFGIKQELFLNQLFFLIIGIILSILTYIIGARFIRLNNVPLYFLYIFLLVVTLLIGTRVRGARRWLNLIIFKFQTTEFFKPFFLLYVAHFLSQKKILRPKAILGGLILIFTPIFLIILQPDLGHGIVFIGVLFSMVYLTGMSLKALSVLIISIAVIVPPLWFTLKSYQQLRIISFINPDLDPQGISYNLHQAVITIGSGKFFGKGLGLGTQSRFRFLPEYHTDFAFASLVEQFGFVGGAIVLILYGVIIMRLIQKAFRHRNDTFAFLYLSGASLMIFSAIFINIGMNVGILPVTGIALPFISYGGSSAVSTMIILAVAMSI